MRGSRGGATPSTVCCYILAPLLQRPACVSAPVPPCSASSAPSLPAQRLLRPPPPQPAWPAPHTAATAVKHARCRTCSERATRLEGAVQRSQGGRRRRRWAGSLGGTRRPVTSRALDVSQPHLPGGAAAQSISGKCALSANARGMKHPARKARKAAPPPPNPSTARPAARFKPATRLRGLTKKQNAACWAARHAVIAARGGPVREPPTNIEAQFEQFVYRGDV